MSKTRNPKSCINNSFFETGLKATSIFMVSQISKLANDFTESVYNNCHSLPIYDVNVYA